jgi:hypothetical protein
LFVHFAFCLLQVLLFPLTSAIVTYEIVKAKDAADKHLAERTEYQLANAHMSESRDEVLFSARGNPIGICIRYTVRFDEGLDDTRYRSNVSLQFDSMPAMWKIQAETIPFVKSSFSQGEYRFTEDFIPYNFPGFMRFPDAPQRADDRCFSWGNPQTRKFAMSSEAQHATIYVFFPRSLDDHVSRRSTSSLEYSQITFYKGAISAGVLNCQ